VDEQAILHEGAELAGRAALSPADVKHLNKLLQDGKRIKREKPDATDRHEISSISQAALREAFQLAEHRLTEVEAQFIAREEQLRQNPQAGSDATQVAAAEKALRRCVRVAKRAGVLFRIYVPSE